MSVETIVMGSAALFSALMLAAGCAQPQSDELRPAGEHRAGPSRHGPARNASSGVILARQAEGELAPDLSVHVLGLSFVSFVALALSRLPAGPDEHLSSRMVTEKQPANVTLGQFVRSGSPCPSDGLASR
jgi:hypothetical protein